MKTFKVYFTRRYSDVIRQHLSATIEADSKTAALQKFAKRFRIKDYTQLYDHQFRWWKHDWMCDFRGIHEVEEVTCPHCQGTGKVKINVAQQTTEETD